MDDIEKLAQKLATGTLKDLAREAGVTTSTIQKKITRTYTNENWTSLDLYTKIKLCRHYILKKNGIHLPLSTMDAVDIMEQGGAMLLKGLANYLSGRMKAKDYKAIADQCTPKIKEAIFKTLVRSSEDLPDLDDLMGGKEDFMLQSDSFKIVPDDN